MRSLFIADLHLHEKRPDITRAFLLFLKQQAADADALYILGDLFEAWTGDDDTSALNQEIITALSQLSASGVQSYIMHGNRDFLLGQQFCQQTGFTLLSDPTPIIFCGETALLMHGDSLCTDDIDYIKFRKMVRNEQWQQEFLQQALTTRQAIAEQMRAGSKEAAQTKDMMIMDVNQQAVDTRLQQHNCRLLIHGHTHRPKIHQWQYKGQDYTRIVLGDWDKKGWFLQCDATKFTLQSFLLD